MTFFICHDPFPRNSGWQFPVFNLEKIVYAYYSPSIANDYGEPLMEVHVQVSDRLDKTVISNKDAYRLLQAMGLTEPPPPDEYRRYPLRKKILPEPEAEPDLDEIPFDQRQTFT